MSLILHDLFNSMCGDTCSPLEQKKDLRAITIHAN